jgi:two-component system, NtrC family, response regulator HupR/HoxA
LTRYSWPGNISELENEIERLIVLGSELEQITADLISPRVLEAARSAGASLQALARTHGNLNEAVEQLEREMIHQGLIRTSNNKSQLARELGISRSNLILKIAKYGLESVRDGGSEDPTARA